MFGRNNTGGGKYQLIKIQMWPNIDIYNFLI